MGYAAISLFCEMVGVLWFLPMTAHVIYFLFQRRQGLRGYFTYPRDGGGYLAIYFARMESVTESFCSCPRWQGLRGHFISPLDSRGYIAISFIAGMEWFAHLVT